MKTESLAEITSTNPVAVPTSTAKRSERLTFWLPLGIILVLAAFLRLYGLGNYPEKFDQDEAVMAYDAWSIWQTGKDQHDNFLPVFFRTFNDFVPPVSNYIAAPFVGIFGLNIFAVRLPFALIGIATILLTALLARRWFNPYAGLFAALFLTLDPWHLVYSRLAYPPSSVPFFTVLALYAFTVGISHLQNKQNKLDKKSSRTAFYWLAISGSSFALLPAVYTAQKLQSVLLMGGCLVAACQIFWKHRWHALVWIGVAGLVASPLIYTQLRYWEAIQIHFNDLSITTEPNWIVTFFRHYGEHYNPAVIFFAPFRGGYLSRPPVIGEFFWLEGLLWLFAIAGFGKEGRHLQAKSGFAVVFMLAYWFFTFPIASSLTNKGIPHEMRSYGWLPLPEILAGYGAYVLFKTLHGYRWRKLTAAQPVAVVGGIILLIFNFMWLSFYFGSPLLQTKLAPTTYLDTYNVGLQPVLEKVAQEARPCDNIWLEEKNQAYVHYLFYTKFPPSELQKADRNEIRDKEGWSRTLWINNITFGRPDRDPPNPKTAEKPECAGQTARLIFVTRTIMTGPEWRELAATRNIAGEIVWRMVIKES